MKKRNTIVTTILSMLVCVASIPRTQAVFPPPDGGYPGFNTAEGQNALLSLTTGQGNTAVGWLALRSVTDGSFNTAVGAGALLSNISGANTATGTGALLSNTTGGNNTANGVVALLNNTEGIENTACGSGALLSNTTASSNTATGFHALFSNVDGDENTATGHEALTSNTTGGGNTAIGTSALSGNTTGSGNTALGYFAGGGVTTAGNVICIGHGGANVSDTTWINHIYGVTTVNGTTLPVLVSEGDQLGTASSSRRFKKEIQPMDKASESILSLKPVTFHYKRDTKETPQFGLIAEEVAQVNPNLVVRDKNGDIYAVRYDQVNAMLLNEFLKEHRKNEKQEATIAELKAEIATLAATVKEQAMPIQNVSAQLSAASPSAGGLEVSESAPRVAINNP
jgi:trimeric autotransporter adhesin